MPKRHTAGDVVVLRTSGHRKPGTKDRRLCRVWQWWTCDRCGRKFKASVVAEYDRTVYAGAGGVGPMVTPFAQRPRWCRPSHKAQARRSPLLQKVCGWRECREVFETRHPLYAYCSKEHGQRETAARRRDRRPPYEPYFAFVLTADQMAMADDVVGVNEKRAEMHAAALRVKAELEAELHALRMQTDPEFRAAERRRIAQERAVADALAAAEAQARAEQVAEERAEAEGRARAEQEFAAQERLQRVAEERARLQARADLLQLDARIAPVEDALREVDARMERYRTGAFTIGLADTQQKRQEAAGPSRCPAAGVGGAGGGAPMTTPTLCEVCGHPVPRKRAAKGFTCCRSCASERNRQEWQARTERLRYLRGPFSPLSPAAKRELPRR